MDQSIYVDKINFGYQQELLFRDFSLEIKAGEFVAVVGANGSGKTTLLKLLSGILRPASGSVKIDGIDINQSEESKMQLAQTHLSVVLQNPEDQFVATSVEEDIAFGLENKRVPKKKMVKIIEEVAQTLQITSLLHKAPYQLSGGQKQRVAIAGSLAMQTPYLLFDEATSQLDPEGKKEVLDAIVTLAREHDKTIVMITHDLTEVLHADRVIVLHAGTVMLDTTPAKLFSQYETQLTDYHLVLPQVIQYSKAFKDAGLLKGQAFSIKELVDKLCK